MNSNGQKFLDFRPNYAQEYTFCREKKQLCTQRIETKRKTANACEKYVLVSAGLEGSQPTVYITRVPQRGAWLLLLW